MSRKILDLARDQQEEIAKEVGQSWADEDDDEPQGEPYVFSPFWGRVSTDGQIKKTKTGH